MCEHDMRALLRDLADGQEPASAVDVAAARRTGKRRLWLRNGSIVGVAAVVILAVVVPSVLFSATPATTASGPETVSPGAISAGAPASPAGSFNPLLQYATFGYLPQAYKIGTKANTPATAFVSTPSMLSLFAVQRSGPNYFQLDVMSKFACADDLVSLVPGWQQTVAKYTPRCATYADENILTAVRAPSVNGRPAYWVNDILAKNSALVWEYAPDAWATLDPSPYLHAAELKQEELKMAATVKFGWNAQINFPFKLVGEIPASWGVYQVLYDEAPDGVNFANSLTVAPELTAHAASGGVIHVGAPGGVTLATGSCPGPGTKQSGSGTMVQVNGVSWRVRGTFKAQGNYRGPIYWNNVQTACTVRPYRGQYTSVTIVPSIVGNKFLSYFTANTMHGILAHLTISTAPQIWDPNPVTR